MAAKDAALLTCRARRPTCSAALAQSGQPTLVDPLSLEATRTAPSPRNPARAGPVRPRQPHGPAPTVATPPASGCAASRRCRWRNSDSGRRNAVIWILVLVALWAASLAVRAARLATPLLWLLLLATLVQITQRQR